jgi:hypothetical protein
MRLGKPGKWMAALLTAAICLSVVGCGNAEVNNDISSEPEPEVVNITQITEDDPEENKVEEITFSDIKEIDEYINENLALDADEEIESCEWVDSDRSCFRVRICYKEAPVNEYKHKRDLFVFVGSKLTSVMVDYPSHDDYSAPRHVCEGNDFEAGLEDVNFDGNKDLLVCLGYSGSNGGSYWCAYLYDRGNYVYNESFERISNYRLEYVSKQIFSSYTEQANSIEAIYEYDETNDEFTEVCSYTGAERAIYGVVADLIAYDAIGYPNESVQDWVIVSTFGDRKNGTIVISDGYEVEYSERMPIEDVEIFYQQVYGEDRSFEAGYEGGHEVGIYCKDDGYAYAHNGVGWGEYTVITNVEETDDGVKVYCDLNDAYGGYRFAAFDFVLTGSDNLFGYSLIKDSVKFTGNALALADAFKNANWAKLTEEDFTYKYGDNTFGITSEWSDYVDALGYPEDFEENNYGYVTTDAAGYRWEMRYPSQSDAEYDFKVVMVSPSSEIDDVDTYIESISLMQTETVRGIKVGDSVDDLATAYGHPEYISLHDGNDKWTDLTYWYKGEYSLVFVIADNKIIAIHMY